MLRLIRKRVSQAQARSGWRRGSARRRPRTCARTRRAGPRPAAAGPGGAAPYGSTPTSVNTAHPRIRRPHPRRREARSAHHAQDLCARPAAHGTPLKPGHPVGNRRGDRGEGGVQGELDQAPASSHGATPLRQEQQGEGAARRTRHNPRRTASHRAVVRSDSAPKSGLATSDTTAPAPVTHASIVSFDMPVPGAKSSAWEASRICSGPCRPAQIAPLASESAEVQTRPTRSTGSATYHGHDGVHHRHPRARSASRSQVYDAFGVRFSVS